MKGMLVVCTVLGISTSAAALDFRIQGAVDMGSPGGHGEPIMGDFTGIDPAAPLALLGVGARLGSNLAPSLIGTPAATDTSFSAVYFVLSGVDSEISPGGFDALAIFDAASDAPILAPRVRIFIRDHSGINYNIEFQGVGMVVDEWAPADGGFMPEPEPLTQSYRLAQYGRTLYLEAIPAPAAASLLGLGLIAAASRRRR